MANLFVRLAGRRRLVLVLGAALTAVLGAKGIGAAHIQGFFDGPH